MIISWNTTNRCNLTCPHCYRDAGSESRGELSTSEAEQMISGIAKAGFKIMIFSGGEPLMREDIFHLVSFAASRGLRPVLGTNGTMITADTALRLKESGVVRAGISLDSLDPAKHDAFRGLPGAFDKTLAAMKNCLSAGLQFQIHTTVMDWNREEICSLADFAAANGASAFHVFFLIPVGRGKFIKETALEINEYEKLLREIMAKQTLLPIEIKPTCAPQFTRIAAQMGLDNRFARGCIAGSAYCIINPAGIVQPCAYLPEAAGDVRAEPFEEIWKNSPVLKKLRTLQYGGSCGKCSFVSVCGGCRARAAYYNDGNYMSEDPYCAYGMELPSNDGTL